MTTKILLSYRTLIRESARERLTGSDFRSAILIDSAGNQQELWCFQHDFNTEARGSCSINWENQMIVFGGFDERRQISRLDGVRLNRIGTLAFDHNNGACSVMNNQIFLCFRTDYSSEGFIFVISYES